MTRPHACAALVTAVVTMSLAGVATAQQTPPPSTTPTTTPTAPTAPTAPAGPPRLTNLKVPAIVEARQGHARFLVGVRTATAARITLQLTAVKGNLLVKTVQSTRLENPGRVYFLVEATNQQRFQLPAGRYRVRVQATDAQSRVSPPLERVITLRLTPPRGRLDAYVMPLWGGIARSLGIPNRGGQLVVAVAPGGDVLKSGIRRGDVITAINEKPTLTPGGMATALRALPADTDVPVVIRRGTEERTVTLKVPPDWNAVPDLSRTLAVVVRRNPRSMAYAVAYARYLVEQGKADDAQELIDAWPAQWRAGAPGQAVQAQLFERSGQAKKALAAWNRARAKDPRMPAAAFGRAIALNSLGKDAEAADAFGDAFRIDPKDASASAFRAFSLIRAENIEESREAALAAEVLDAEYADGKVAAGIALIRTRNPARGVVKLREGLILTDDPARAQTIIDQYLEPADK